MQLFLSLRQWGDLALFILRLGVGVVFFVHGRQKWPMWKAQLSATMPPGMLNIMRILSVAETLGALAVLTGFLTQLAALGLAIVMVGAINLKVNRLHKSFTGDGGWELDYGILCTCLALLFLGAGIFSLDHVLFAI